MLIASYEKNIKFNIKHKVMETKKSIRSNLERKRTLFFEYGLIVALAFSLLAFESGANKEPATNFDYSANKEYVPEEMIEITRPEPPKVKPPVIDDIIILDNSEPEFPQPDIDWGDVKENTVIDFVPWEPEEERVKEPEIFIKVEKMPKYNGGDVNTFQRDLQKLVEYPQQAQELGIQGKVILQFVVDENGKLTNAKVVQSEDKLLSDAVMKALSKTKKWKAGEQRGRKVKVTFTIPVFFRLG
jgi:periplasmic protein TonB